MGSAVVACLSVVAAEITSARAMRKALQMKELLGESGLSALTDQTHFLLQEPAHP